MNDTNVPNVQSEHCVIQIEEETGDVDKNNNDDETEKEKALPYGAELSDKQRREHIINMLTEKQPEAVIDGKHRRYMVYFQKFEATAPTGGPVEYESGNRNDFVRLVFFLVFCMLLVTASATFAVYQMKEVQEKMRTLPGLIALFACLIIIIVINYTFCCSACSRVVPCNYILLVFATLAYSYLCAFLTAKYAPNIVLGAVLTTLAITMLCLGLAFTSIDFTKFLLIVIVASMALFFALIIATVISKVFGVNITIVRLVILIVSSIVSSVCMIIEFQMILGGKSVELGEEDYAYGAFLVYTSIIDMFLKMLQIINTIVNLEDLI